MIARPTGLLLQHEVNKGYRSYVATEDTPMLGDAREDAHVLATLKKGKHFAIQSKVNPERSARPPQMPPVNGFVVGYPRQDIPRHGRPTVFVRREHLERDDDPEDVWAKGPTKRKLDFQVPFGAPRDKTPQEWPRGHALDGTVHAVKDDDAYARDAEESTAFARVFKGDRVKFIWRIGNYTFCEAVECVSPVLKRGDRFFVINMAFTEG
jgi:hypothetical protein